MKVIILYKLKEDIKITDPELKSDELKRVKNISFNGEYIEIYYEMENLHKVRGIVDMTRIPKEEVDEIKIKRD